MIMDAAAEMENRRAEEAKVGDAVRSEPWSFVLLGLAVGVLAGILLKSPVLRRVLGVYTKLSK